MPWVNQKPRRTAPPPAPPVPARRSTGARGRTLTLTDEEVASIDESTQAELAALTGGENPDGLTLLQTIDGLLGVIDRLRAERLVLAKLAATEPQFDNPLEAWAAQGLRDRILQEVAHARR